MLGPDSLLRLLELKSVVRAGWTRFPEIPQAALESVADHSYGVALLGWLLCPEDLDRNRVMELALLHDLAEVLTGDRTPGDAVEPQLKVDEERRALDRLLSGFSAAQRGEELLREYQEQSTPEAKFVKAVDKLDMALQSLAYERDFSVVLEEFRCSGQSHLAEYGLERWLAWQT